MTDPTTPTPETQCACACLRVSYTPIENPDGTMSERWTCNAGCGSTFVRKAHTKTETPTPEEPAIVQTMRRMLRGSFPSFSINYAEARVLVEHLDHLASGTGEREEPPPTVYRERIRRMEAESLWEKEVAEHRKSCQLYIDQIRKTQSAEADLAAAKRELEAERAAHIKTRAEQRRAVEFFDVESRLRQRAEDALESARSQPSSGQLLHTCINTYTTSDARVPPPCVACQASPPQEVIDALRSARPSSKRT